MSFLCDYFRADGTATVIAAMERAEGQSLVGAGSPAFDGVHAKGVDELWWDPLVAAAAGVAHASVPSGADVVIWPTTPCAGPELPDDDPWATGPWVSELRQEVRDVLASVADAELSRVTADWVRACDPSGDLVTAERMRPLTGRLVGLARRAREADARLYCWTCL